MATPRAVDEETIRQAWEDLDSSGWAPAAAAPPPSYDVGTLQTGDGQGLAVSGDCSRCSESQSLFLDMSAGVVCGACGIVYPNTLPSVAPGAMTTRKDENDGSMNTALHSTVMHTSGPLHYMEAGGCVVENTRRAKRFLGLSVHRRCAHPYRTPIQRSVYSDKMIMERIYDSFQRRHMRALPGQDVMDSVFSSALSYAIRLKEEQYEEKSMIEGKKAPTNRGSKRFGVLSYCIYLSIVQASKTFITEEEFLRDVVLPAWDGEPCDRSIKGGFAEARLRLNSASTGSPSPLMDLVKLVCAKASETVVGTHRVAGKYPGFWRSAFMEKCSALADQVDSVKLSEHKPHAISAAVAVVAARELGLDAFTHPLAPVITLDKCCEYLRVSRELVASHIQGTFRAQNHSVEPVPKACSHPFKPGSDPSHGPIFVLRVVDKYLGL